MGNIYKMDCIEIKKLMVERGIKSVTELATKTGVNRNTLAKVLEGTIQPTAYVMGRFVSALDIPPEQAGRIFFARKLRIA